MEDRPARAGDLRGLRRWLLVAAVWATAATAIAVIALITATNARDDNSAAGRQNARTTDQIATAQRQLEGRLDRLERRMGVLASADDVADLDNRLKRAEGADGRTADGLEELTTSFDDLEGRVESLEDDPADPPGAGTRTTP